MRPLMAALAAACLLTVASPASAYTLGAGDRADGDPTASRALGARVYRVVIDADLPLSTYDARIMRFRAAGLEPQLVIGGTGTRRHANRWGLDRVAVAAARRWPFAYSVSVVNEPDLSGMSACGYARTYVRSYRLLKRAGVRRVLFGEWSPDKPLDWTRAVLTRCGVRLHVDRFAWHGYDFDASQGSIGNAPAIRAWLHAHRSRLGGHTPRLYVTEYGVLTSTSEVAAAAKWRRALRVARQYLAELVAWDVHSPAAGSAWDSSLIEPCGRQRPAFHVIAAARMRP